VVRSSLMLHAVDAHTEGMPAIPLTASAVAAAIA
jgi:hypothetical protein